MPFRNRDFGHDVGIGGWEIDSRDIDMADYWYEHKLGADGFIYDSDDETSSTVQWAHERYRLPIGVTETYSKSQAEASPSPAVCITDLNSDGVIHGSDYTLTAPIILF